ncbi:hypothetical protein GGR51DRAFT_509699 [Nemania sp. FL0031]|nr:hypothetical protein GGR51DRAFT_509699 [Nemania sp. FL0031]
MAEQPLGQGEGGGIDAIPVEVEVDIAPDRTPTFANFPILRAVLFLAGFDVNTALDQARRSELEARYTRIVFAHLSVGNSPDTSSTRHILSSSWIESVSALCIVAAVTVLVWQFYARPGEDGDAGPGLALHVEAPILAALCTTFALIIAVYTYLAADDSCEPILSCFSLNEVFTPANQEVCAICRESSSEDLVRLQCYSTAEEAANPQRAFHFVHSDCIALWWVEQRERWHASGQRDAAPEPRCILCNNRVLGYRPLDMASPSPSNFPVLSALAWALYFFFASTLVLFGHLSGFSYRGLPGPKDVRADWHAFVITRGILTIFLLLLSRLLFARITYAFYLVYPQLLRTYLDSSQIVSQYVLSKVRLTWSSLCSWPSFPQPLQSLVCTPEFPDAWLADSPPTSSLGKGQGWCLAIVFLVAFFIFIHRCASQAADAIYYRFPPRDIREGLRFRPRNSSVTLVNFIRRISLPLNVFNTLIFNFPSGQDMGFNSNMDYAASLVACIIWTFWLLSSYSLPSRRYEKTFSPLSPYSFQATSWLNV